MSHPTHPVCELFPLMNDEEFTALVEDIREHGLREPICLHEGAIVDGRNRYRACEMLDLSPRFTVWNGKGSLTAFVLSMNLKRRHLTKSQLAMVAVEALPLFEAEAKARQAEQARRNQPQGQKVAQLPPLEKTKARTQAAQTAKVGDRYVSDAKKIRQASPVIAAKVRSGELTLQDAKKAVKIEQQKQTAKVDPWPADEQQLRKALQRGETVVVNVKTMAHITAWARERDLLVMVDRTTDWGNPFKLGDDGERDSVVAKYRRHYLPHKNKLQSLLSSLRGKALGCHCAPAACHADAIVEALGCA